MLIDNLEDSANANVTFCVSSVLFEDYFVQAIEGPLDRRKYHYQQFVIAVPTSVRQ